MGAPQADSLPSIVYLLSSLRRSRYRVSKGGASQSVRRHHPLGRRPFPLRHFARRALPLSHLSQSHHHLSAVGSSLLRREPPVESISRFRCRVVRNPIAAKPLISSISYTSPYFLTLSLKRHLERWKNTKCLYSPKSLQLR